MKIQKGAQGFCFSFAPYAWYAQKFQKIAALKFEKLVTRVYVKGQAMMPCNLPFSDIRWKICTQMTFYRWYNCRIWSYGMEFGVAEFTLTRKNLGLLNLVLLREDLLSLKSVLPNGILGHRI